MKKLFSVLLALLFVASCIPSVVNAETTSATKPADVAFVLQCNGGESVFAHKGDTVEVKFYINQLTDNPQEQYKYWQWSIWLDFDSAKLQFVSCQCEKSSKTQYTAGTNTIKFEQNSSPLTYAPSQLIATLQFKVLCEEGTNAQLVFNNESKLLPFTGDSNFFQDEVDAYNVELRTFTVCTNKTYTVKYTDGNDSTELFADQSFVADAGSVTPEFVGTPTRDGYHFVGWKTKQGGNFEQTVTHDVTYIPKWEQLFYVVYNEGYSPEPNYFTKTNTIKFSDLIPGSPMPKPDDPVRDGYVFVGWTDGINGGNPPTQTVVRPATYYSQWLPLYTVTYTDGVDGEEIFADDVHADIVKGSTTPQFVGGVPTRKGYAFDGWGVVSPTVLKNATYVARWVTAYSVTYLDGANGTVFESQSYEVINSLAIPEFVGTPQRDGYFFGGWSEVTEPETGNKTYTAQWQKKCCPWCLGIDYCPWCATIPLIGIAVLLLK